MLRLVYVTAAAVALAPRINESDADKRRFGIGYSRDNMPRGPADKAPTFIIDAFSALIAAGEGVSFVTWRHVLDRIKLVRNRIRCDLRLAKSNSLIPLPLHCTLSFRSSRRT